MRSQRLKVDQLSICTSQEFKPRSQMGSVYICESQSLVRQGRTAQRLAYKMSEVLKSSGSGSNRLELLLALLLIPLLFCAPRLAAVAASSSRLV